MKINRNSILALSTLVVMGVSGCAGVLNKQEPNEKAPEDPEESVVSEAGDIVNLVETAEIRERIENEETFAFVIGDETCPACITYDKELKKFSEDKKIKLDYIDLNKVDEDEVENVGVLLFEELGVSLEDGFGTPTTLLIVDGELEKTLPGAISFESLKSEYEDVIENDKEDSESQE